MLDLECILHTLKGWHSQKDVSRRRDKRVDVLSFPFHQLKLLPTRVHRPVTVMFCSTHSVRILSVKEAFARSDKLSIGAVFQCAAAKHGKAPWPPSTTPQTAALC